MAIRNPLRNSNSRPQESKRGDQVINMKTERLARLPRPDGTMHEYVMETRETAPDQSGTLVDRQTTNIHADSSGKVLPEDPRSVIAVSHTGLNITADEFSTCTSRLHPRHMNRNIRVGYDGEHLPDGGARCSDCDRKRTRIYIGVAGAGLVFLLGLYKAAGFF